MSSVFRFRITIRKGTADSTYRIQYVLRAIQWLAVDGVIPFVATGLTVVGMIYIIAVLDWQLAVVAIAISPVLYLGARTFNSRLRNQWGQILCTWKVPLFQ